MDFLDPKKKRAHAIRLYIGYFLMAIAVILTAWLLVFLARGYNLNIKTGEITQNGLVFIDAHPEAAEVFVNGESKGSTDMRLILEAGNYTFELRRPGYRTWQRQLTLVGETIERLVYPFLFPETLETSETQLYATRPTFASQSPDRRWLLVRPPNSTFGFDLIDLNTELGSGVRLELPLNLFNTAGTRHDVSAVEWSTDNRHVVLKHTFDTGSEFVLIDREDPASSQNLSSVFAGTAFTDISLRDKRFDRYYLHNKSTQILMTAQLNNAVPIQVLSGVLQFKPHDDDVILYVTNTGAKEGRALVRVLDNGQGYTVRDLPADTTYLLDIARFANRWYIVAGSVSDERIYVLREPVAALQRNPEARIVPAGLLRTEKPEHVSFSTNARFIALQAGSRFVVYDAETDRSYRYDTGLELGPGQKATWMDGHRLTLVSQGSVHVFDFDGTNKQVLSAAYPEFVPYFNSGYTAFYTLADSQIAGRATLLRTELIVAPEND